MRFNTVLGRAVLLLALALPPSPAAAITNIEEIDIAGPGEGVGGSLDVGLNGASGNSDRFGIDAGARLAWRHGAHLDFALANYTYAKSQGVLSANSAFLHLRHRTRFRPAWQWEAFLQGARDEFARLTFRGLAGGGVRWTVRERPPEMAAYLGLGGFYERERLDATVTTAPRNRSFWRLNAYLTLKQRITPTTRVMSTTYYQPSLADRGDFRLLEEAAMLVKVNESIDVKFSIEVRHDSRPPLRVEKTDILYATGLSFRF